MKTFLRIALLAGLTSAGSALAQNAAPAPAPASAPPFAVRAEVAKELNAAIDLFRGGKAAEARAAVEKAMQTVPAPQPSEVTAMNRLYGLLSLQLDKPADAVKALETALQINQQLPQDTLACQEALARAHFNLKAYPAAQQWARKAQESGSKSGAMQQVLVRSTYLQNDFAGTVKLLEEQQRSAALPFDELRLLAASYGNLKEDAKYLALTERLLREHGRTEYWPDVLSRVQRQAGWQARWDVDLYRLRMQLDQMDEADDYVGLADLYAKAGLPIEAQKVLEAGYTKGMLGKGAQAGEHGKFRAAMAKAAADDRQALASAASRPPAVDTARAAGNTFTTGLALAGSGQADKGLELMKAALGGPLADPGQARLQYALALHQAGRTPEALEQLKGITSPDPLALLARLWQTALSAPRKS